MMTNEDFVAKAGERCPNCGSDAIETLGQIQADGASAWQEVECDACGIDYQDVWQLVGYDIQDDALPKQRKIYEIAREIRQLWKKVWFGAEPYLKAMETLQTIDDTYGWDDARSIILYFLANATTWRGEDARRIKAELKELANTK